MSGGGIKKHTVKSWREYVSPWAQQLGVKHGIPWKACVVITALETGRGRTDKYNMYNNWGGVKYAGSGAPSFAIGNAEEQDKSGKTYNVPNTKWAVWNDKFSGLEGWFQFFKRNPRYKKALQHPNDPHKFIFEIRQAGYATGKNYVPTLYSMLKQYFPDDKSNEYYINHWNTELSKNTIEQSSEFTYIKPKYTPPPMITNVQEMDAVGIWQIVKVLADHHALTQTVNDAVIAFEQGSLINFVKKIIHEPWLEFFGDTYRDQYYFTARKERFDYNGFTSTYNTEWVITENEVLSDSLTWYSGPVYSWYQIIPQGSFLGEQNQIFAYITAVFFQEYAEIFGSKPLSLVNNYLNFTKTSDSPILEEKALQDLRYMVESNCYLPFTREGTITVVGKPQIRRGYWILYKPTMEMFYVDGVDNKYNITDGGEEIITTIKVSRGMEIRHLVAPKDKTTKSYWNLILFGDEEPTKENISEEVSEKRLKFYFDNDRSYLIIKDETWGNGSPSPDTRDKKMENQIKEFPNLRNELYEINQSNIDEAVRLIENNPQCNKFLCIGYIDSDSGMKDTRLPNGRANTVKNKIVDAYIAKHPAENRETLLAKIDINDRGVSKITTEERVELQDQTDKKYKEKAYQRYAEFIVPKHKKISEHQNNNSDGLNWRVNDEVFQYFINRKQFNNCN